MDSGHAEAPRTRALVLRKLADDRRAYVGVALVALPLSYFFAGPNGLMGMAMGLAGTSLSVIGLWAVVRMCGRAAPQGARPILGAIVSVLAFLVKLPVFILLSVLTFELGGAAGPCFLAGLALVYLCLVGWALAHS